jgi:hypothetical protein
MLAQPQIAAANANDPITIASRSRRGLPDALGFENRKRSILTSEEQSVIVKTNIPGISAVR